MTTFERETLIADCRDACRPNVLRTDDESREIRERGAAAAQRLGFKTADDVCDVYGLTGSLDDGHSRLSQ